MKGPFCPLGILWVKKFNSKQKEHSVTAITANGRGGMLLSQMINIKKENEYLKYPLSKKQEKFTGSSTISIYRGGNFPGFVTFRCTKADTAAIIAGCNAVIDALRGRSKNEMKPIGGSASISTKSEIQNRSLGGQEGQATAAFGLEQEVGPEFGLNRYRGSEGNMIQGQEGHSRAMSHNINRPEHVQHNANPINQSYAKPVDRISPFQETTPTRYSVLGGIENRQRNSRGGIDPQGSVAFQSYPDAQQVRRHKYSSNAGAARSVNVGPRNTVEYPESRNYQPSLPPQVRGNKYFSGSENARIGLESPYHQSTQGEATAHGSTRPDHTSVVNSHSYYNTSVGSSPLRVMGTGSDLWEA